MSTTNLAPGLRIAGPGDIDEVANIVADPFQDLEVIRYLVPDNRRRYRVSRGWFRLHIAHAIDGAGRVVVADGGKAAAVWFDRTAGFTEPDGYAERLAELAGPDLPRFEHLETQMAALHPDEAHWHLLFLAVRPGWQNKGLGSKLPKHTHSALDGDRIPAYLEATGPDNRRLYQRHGYTDMSQPTIAVSGETVLYRMWRKPESARP